MEFYSSRLEVPDLDIPVCLGLAQLLRVPGNCVDVQNFPTKMFSSQENSKYSHPDYWNERYLSEEEHEWLGDYRTFSSILAEEIADPRAKILMLGCGNSSFSGDMYNSGYENIVNVDISDICINKMAQMHKDKKMQWLVSDATDLKEFQDESFNVVIEKATLDSLIASEKSPWSLSKEGEGTIRSCLHSVSRVLKDRGVFISITLSPSHFRGPILAVPDYGWSVNHKVHWSKTSLPYHIFIMRKGETLSEEIMRQCSYQSRLIILENSNVEQDEDDPGFLMKIDLGP